jgi:hypothetical protein
MAWASRGAALARRGQLRVALEIALDEAGERLDQALALLG